MASLTLRGIRKQLGSNPILRGIDLTVEDGEFAVIVGPSGCGKSTLLRTVAGLEEPDEGTIHLAERDVTHEPPRGRDVGMVFQSYALYPHLTVRENIAFGLRLRKTPDAQVRSRVDEVARMLSLEKLLDRYPRDMSGGQRQRVAMGRAIARRPSLFLFDEPLSNLDAALRAEVRVQIKKLHGQLGTTMLYVTHDQVEAMTLADRLVVLNAGKLEQQGPPLDVYHHPVSKFVAGFLGSPPMNFLEVNSATEGTVRSEGVTVQHPHAKTLASGSLVTLGVRPHDVVRINAKGTAGMPTSGATGYRDSHDAARSGISLSMIVDVVEAMGFEAFAHGHVGKQPFVARMDTTSGDFELPRVGETLELTVSPEALHLFDPTTGRTVGTEKSSEVSVPEDSR